MINMSTTDNTAIYNNRYDNTIIGVINVFLSDINADTFNYFPQCLQRIEKRIRWEMSYFSQYLKIV